MSTYNICFYVEIRKITPKLLSDTPPLNSSVDSCKIGCAVCMLDNREIFILISPYIWKGENDHSIDFMINLHESYVAKLGFKLAIPGSALLTVLWSSNCWVIEKKVYRAVVLPTLLYAC